MYEIKPIGFFEAIEEEKYAVSRQPAVLKGNRGKIVLNPGCNFEQALSDLDGFDRIFVIYRFSKNHAWKPKVLPTRGDKKRGVFATRSPHRPNFLGLSCLQLIDIQGLTLNVINHDLLNGTPIFDIKPYIVYADCFPDAKQGWLEEVGNEPLFAVKWLREAQEQRDFLEMKWKVLLASNIYPRLSVHPFPKKQNRIKALENGFYEIAYKTWRVRYAVDLQAQEVIVHEIYSGYDAETLAGERACPYNDLECHLDFNML